MNDKMLSPEDVAERLAVNPAAVRLWLRSGKIKGIELGKKMWRKVDLMVLGLKEQANLNKSPAYIRARRALSSIKGSLSNDINEERKERL